MPASGLPLVAHAAKLNEEATIIHVPNSLIDEPSFFHCVDGGPSAARFGFGCFDLRSVPGTGHEAGEADDSAKDGLPDGRGNGC